MLEEQKHLIELLVEFDQLCDDAGAVYSLAEQTLLWAKRSIAFRGCEAEVAMTLDAYRSFALKVAEQGRPDRELEGLDNNPTMPGWYFRYVDSSSTLFALDYARCRRAHGVGINIHIIRLKDYASSELYDYELGMQAQIIPDVQYGQKLPKPAKKAYQRLERKRNSEGAEQLCSRLSSSFESTCLLNTDDEGCLVAPQGVRVLLPAGFLSRVESVTLQGRRFKASTKSDSYLSARFEEKAEKGIPYYRRQGYMVTYSSTVPYAQFIPEVQEIVSDEKFWQRRDEWLSAYHSKVAKEGKAQNARWQLFYLIGDRYRDWRRFAPKKSTIKELYDNGRHGLLWLALAPYRSHLEAYAKKKMAFTIDEDIWDICIDLYRENGRGEFADKLLELYEQNPLPPIEGPEITACLDKLKQAEERVTAPIFGFTDEKAVDSK